MRLGPVFSHVLFRSSFSGLDLIQQLQEENVLVNLSVVQVIVGVPADGEEKGGDLALLETFLNLFPGGRELAEFVNCLLERESAPDT